MSFKINAKQKDKQKGRKALWADCYDEGIHEECSQKK